MNRAWKDGSLACFYSEENAYILGMTFKRVAAHVSMHPHTGAVVTKWEFGAYDATKMNGAIFASLGVYTSLAAAKRAVEKNFAVKVN